MDLPLIVALAAAGCGAVIATAALWRAGRAKADYLLALGMYGTSACAVVAGLAQATHEPGEVARLYSWTMRGQAELAVFWLVFSSIYARGNYQEFLVEWKWIWAGGFLLPFLLAAGWRGGCVFLRSNVITGVFELGLTAQGVVLQSVSLIATIAALTNLEHTFRASVGTIRWRLKYTVVGLGLLLAVRAYTESQALLYRLVDPFLITINSVALFLSSLLILRSLLRGGQSEVAVFPGKAVFLNSVTILAAGAYLLTVGVLAKVAAWFGGDASFQLKAFAVLISVAGATVVALSDRARLRLRRWTSYYLQKPLYDYRSVWRSFTEGIAVHFDEETLCQSVTTLTARTFEMLSVSIWLVDEKKEILTCAASTTLSAAATRDVQPTSEEVKEIIHHFQAHHEPVNLEKDKAAWAEALRRAHPAQFRTGGDRMAAPLTAGGELLGLMLLGDRVGGVRFSLQDFDLLRCVADQVAAGLRNARLSQRLLQTKEMEAFQAMSTFFVHDLKNLASTLNLMLKNLPIHFDNPEFRADALRGIGKTCDHINHLISRLSLLREGFQIRPAESDLNKVVAQALSRCPAPSNVQLARELRDLPNIMIDAEQIDKVITNLALNAMEAVSGSGRVSIETSQTNGWAVLAVTDTGVGMDSDFLGRSLFRPFQTTKKKGLGIGMFQSKMIVEAHGGRIEVQSEKGKGSTFRVLLPLPKSVA